MEPNNENNGRRRLRVDVEKEWEDVPLDTKLVVVYECSDEDFEPSKKVFHSPSLRSEDFPDIQFAQISRTSDRSLDMSECENEDSRKSLIQAAGILTPGVRIVQNTSKYSACNFRRGKSYLRYVHPSEDDLDSKNLYDMDRFSLSTCFGLASKTLSITPC